MASYWRPEVLESVVDKLREGNLCLFAGAGLSCVAGYPSWTDLMKGFAEAYKGLPGRDGQLEAIMDELVKDKDGRLNILDHLMKLQPGGEDELVRVLKESFEKEKTSNAHRLLMSLPFRGYVTTNYDRCFEVACAEVNGAKDLLGDRWFCFPKHKHAPERTLDGIYDGDRFLLHMHGCLYCKGRIDSMNIILMNSQYSSFYKSNEIEKIYTDLFYQPFLILGTSFGDPWFMRKLFDARGCHDRDLRSERKTCYVVLPECERRATDPSNEDVYGVKFNYFDRSDNTAIENMVRELKAAYEETVRMI